MQRRHVLSLLAGVSVCPGLQGKPAVPASPESLIHDLPRTAEALFDLTHGAPILPTAQIELIAPPLVEFAPRWPVRVVNRMPGVTWMALVIEQNPQPMAALFRFGHGALTEIRSYLKIADSTQVTVVVAAAGKFYGLRRFITVIGNCM